MNRVVVGQILRQIESGNSVFDLNSTEEARLLGYELGAVRTEDEAAQLRYCLDMLERQGIITIDFVSVANNCVVNITGLGRKFLATFDEH